MLYKKEIEDKKGLNGISFQKARTLRILWPPTWAENSGSRSPMPVAAAAAPTLVEPCSVECCCCCCSVEVGGGSTVNWYRSKSKYRPLCRCVELKILGDSPAERGRSGQKGLNYITVGYRNLRDTVQRKGKRTLWYITR
jgi:hypothetical protein